MQGGGRLGGRDTALPAGGGGDCSCEGQRGIKYTQYKYTHGICRRYTEGIFFLHYGGFYYMPERMLNNFVTILVIFK